MLSHRVFRISLTLATALVLLGVPNLAQADCEDEWDKSSAAETCDPDSINANGNQCAITALCTAINQSSVSNVLFVSVDDVADLHNCDGTLKVGSC